MLRSIADVLAAADEQQEWIIDPYIARRGITFLHGKTSIGKSPLSWEIVRTVSQALDFFGHPTIKSRVLYIEADAPEILLRPRLRLLPTPIGDWRIAFIAGQSLNLCDDKHPMFYWFKQWQDEWHPELVVWNTLRHFYKGNAIDSDIVPRVYDAIQREFPQAAHLVSAHDRKTSTDANVTEQDNEAFAGSAAWRDLATVGLHLVKRGDKAHGQYLSLEHTKTMVSEELPPLKLHLDPDGTRLTAALHPLTPTVLIRLAEMASANVPGNRMALLAKELNISLRTVFRIKRSANVIE